MAHFDAVYMKGAEACTSYESCCTFIHSGKHVACYHIASLLFQYLGGYQAMGGQWFLGDFIFHVLIVIFLLFFIRPFVLNSHVIYCLSSFFVVILS